VEIVPRAVADAAPTITGVFAPPKAVILCGEAEDGQEILNDLNSYTPRKTSWDLFT